MSVTKRGYLHSLVSVECDSLCEQFLHAHQHPAEPLDHSEQFRDCKLLLQRVVVPDGFLVVAGVVGTVLVEERVYWVTQLPVVHVVQLTRPRGELADAAVC